MTKLHNLAPVLLLAFAPVAALADDYQFEIRGGFDRHLPTSDDDSSADVDVATLGGTWYFAPVTTNNVPLAEASYLGRASFLSGWLTSIDLLGTTLDTQGVQVGYYIPGTMFYAAVGAAHQEEAIGLSSAGLQKEYDTRWFGRLGITPLDGLLVTTELREHGYDPNIGARYVGKLPNKHFYAGSVYLVDTDDDTSFGLDFDYYFDDSTSLGAGFDSGDNRLELRAERFFSKSWAAGVSAYTADRIDGFGAHVTWRH